MGQRSRTKRGARSAGQQCGRAASSADVDARCTHKLNKSPLSIIPEKKTKPRKASSLCILIIFVVSEVR